MYLCPVCEARMSSGCESWHYVCAACGYEAATLAPLINDSRAHELIDEASREAGLKTLRVANFQRLLSRMSRIRPGGKLLEVGSAYGWFLEEAGRSFEVHGLEPDQQVFRVAEQKGLPVRMGYFPDAIAPSELYDIIVFNDVIEHIPDIRAVLRSCYEHLVPGGLLVLNLPNSKGIFYRIAAGLKRLRSPGPFRRMWQVGLPSPHVHYFDSKNLVRLLERHGFQVRESGRLATLGFSGLFTRISYTGKANRVRHWLMWATLVMGLPMLRLLPSDIMYVIASARPAETSSDNV